MIPAFIHEKLANVPEAGGGIHAWLFSIARQLWAHMDGPAIEAILSLAVTNAGRRVPVREIRDAVYNARGVAWKRGERGTVAGIPVTDKPGAERVGTPEAASWPKPNQRARIYASDSAALDGVAGLADLWEKSPKRPPAWGADDWLEWLFPGAEWLCLAVDHPATARSRPPEKWSFGPAEECGLIVPSPMTAAGGLDQDGKRSHRCLDNTGPRRWLVLEFDKLEDGKTNMPIDEQASLHWHLSAAGLALGWPLRLCVHSGGKSLHGWYGPSGDEAQAFDLQAYAASLGADTAGWNRCQLMRLPGGRRKRADANPWNLPDGFAAPGPYVTQEVFYFDPSLNEYRQFSQATG